MKKLIPMVFVLFGTLPVCSQDTISRKITTPQEYLKRSAEHKKTGWILLGTGLSLCAGSLLFPRGERTGTVYGLPGGAPTYKNEDFKFFLMIGGALCSVISFSQFIRSGANKKKAASVY